MMLATVACAVAVAILLAAERAEWTPGIAAAKIAASSAFVCVAVQGGALSSPYGRTLLGGLLLCWLGDACLLSPGRSTAFLLGIGSFLLGHLAFAIAFFEIGIDPAGFAIGAVLLAVFAWRVLRWLRPHVPDDFRIAVASYVVVISVMVATAIGAGAHGAPLLVGLGAVGFALSDLAVARDRFVSPAFANAAWGLPLYFASQLALAHSVSAFASP